MSKKQPTSRGFGADPQAATGKVITAEVDGIDMKELSVTFICNRRQPHRPGSLFDHPDQNEKIRNVSKKQPTRRGFWADPQAATGKVITAEVDGNDMKQLSVAFFCNRRQSHLAGSLFDHPDQNEKI